MTQTYPIPSLQYEEDENYLPIPIAHETENQEVYQETIKWDRFFSEDILKLPTFRNHLTVETLNSIPDFLSTLTNMLLEGPGRKIDAIKYVRQATNLGLKEAKDFVDEFQIEVMKN
jgi:hypothetical protein